MQKKTFPRSDIKPLVDLRYQMADWAAGCYSGAPYVHAHTRNASSLGTRTAVFLNNSSVS